MHRYVGEQHCVDPVTNGTSNITTICPRGMLICIGLLFFSVIIIDFNMDQASIIIRHENEKFRAQRQSESEI